MSLQGGTSEKLAKMGSLTTKERSNKAENLTKYMPASARLVAFYLPQFHPIPENDRWWGKGFTEWTHVTKARPLFRGHYQPHLPADLGFYDLRVPEVREAQAELARNAGIEAFCYYHYWFAGRRLLERPFSEVLATGRPDFPFCLCWANETWSGVWHGAPHRVLIEQTYPGAADNRKHFETLRDAFLDRRYLRVDGRPVFVIFNPAGLPDPKDFIQQWQQLARENGLPGLHFIAYLDHCIADWNFKARGFDGSIAANPQIYRSLSKFERVFGKRVSLNPEAQKLPGTPVPNDHRGAMRHGLWRLCRALWGQFNNVVEYRHALPYLLQGTDTAPDVYPCVIPNWDNTPRSGRRGHVLHGSTPELFRNHLRAALQLVHSRAPDRRLLFVKSWNEWAEGNHLEPDQKFGHAYLEVVREEVTCRAEAKPNIHRH